jgi:protein subunit release factor B
MVANENVYINKAKIKYYPIKSSGSGGQKINKVSTAILLKYYIRDQDYPQWFIKNLKRNLVMRFQKKIS